MARLQHNDLLMKYAVFLVLGAVAAAQVLACRGMYADGPNLLLEILSTRDFLTYEKHRLTFQYMTEFPIIFLLRHGYADLMALRYLYSALLLLTPLLFWALALAAVKDDVLFWPLAVSEMPVPPKVTALPLKDRLPPSTLGPSPETKPL